MHLLALHLARDSGFALALPYCVQVQENGSACMQCLGSLIVLLLVGDPCFEAGRLLFGLHITRASSFALALPWGFPIQESSKVRSAYGLLLVEAMH